MPTPRDWKGGLGGRKASLGTLSWGGAMSAGDTCVSQPLLSVPSHQGTGGQGVGTSRNRLSPGTEPRPVSWAQGPPAGTTHLAGQSRLGRTERSGLVQCGRRGSRGWGWALWVGRDLGAWLPGPLPPSGLRELLTHTECSLGVQLKALRAAGILVLCKAKRPPLRSRRSPPGAPARPRLPAPSCWLGAQPLPEPGRAREAASWYLAWACRR